jgi:hypothetical protein
MAVRNNLAVQAVQMAAQARRKAGIEGTVPLCVYDLIETAFHEEIDLRFQPLKSLEGMYSRQQDGTGIIIVSSERPNGRRRYTCAHELGHHLFKHQLSLDELAEEHRASRKEPREVLADLFAGFLLMPKLALLRAARERGIDLGSPSAEDIYRLASYFGVGFMTLLNHASRSLEVLDRSTAERLARTLPKTLRENLLGKGAPGDLIMVDSAWRPCRPVDAVVGDHVLLPKGTLVEGLVLRLGDGNLLGDVYQAVSPGIGRVEHGDWSSFVRVERARYCGMGRFRNLEECDDE